MSRRCMHCLADATHGVRYDPHRRPQQEPWIIVKDGKRQYCKWHASVAAVRLNAALRRDQPQETHG